jgi:hypothetical protein
MRKQINSLQQREARRAGNLRASVVLGQQIVVECQVQDLSVQGAKILVSSPSMVPTHFELAFNSADQGRSCQVIWRRNRLIGVKFI